LEEPRVVFDSLPPREPKGAGLRALILGTVVGLLLLAFLPLAFAVASVTSARERKSREEAAHLIAETAAVGFLSARDPNQLLTTSVTRICSIAESRCAGGLAAEGRDLHVSANGLPFIVRTRLPGIDPRSIAAPAILYSGLFALMLLTLLYLAITRLIVHPLDQIVRFADRIASGARRIVAPRMGSRETIGLADSIEKMAKTLVRDEDALREKIVQLRQTTESLTAAQDQVVRSERLASVGRLAAGLAHEVGNPLTALIGMQDLMLDGDLDEAARRDFLTRMRKETNRIHAVLRDLLDFARPEASGAPDSKHEGATVRSVAEQVIALARMQRTSKLVQFVINIEADDPPVAMSSHRLTQVLLNLVLNAIDGAAHVSDPRVEVSATWTSVSVTLAVLDNGPGVAKAMRRTLFEPFASSKPTGSGTGLGLAVCRGLVEAALGTIELDDSSALGARFVVTLPRAQ
jgi:signal transduction histidine kinase